MDEEEKLLYSVDAEMSFLGAMLIDPAEMRNHDLAPAEFYVQKHAWIWEAMGSLDRNSYDVDVVTLAEYLDRRGKLVDIGGASYLAELITITPSSYGVVTYGRIIRDYYHRRIAVKAASSLAAAAYDNGQSLDRAITEVMNTLSLNIRANTETRHIRGVLSELYDQAKERIEAPSDMWGLETGFTDFDKATGGLQPGEVYYLAGEPGIGKSKLAVQMGMQIGARNIPGAIFSLEMSALQLVRRSISAIAEIPTRHIKTGRMDDEEWVRLTEAIETASDYPVYINELAGITTNQLRAELARLINQYGIQWAVIDYLLLMGDDDGKDETEVSAKLSRRIKEIANRTGLAMITVNSVTKDAMDDSKKPSQKQLRGSGQVVHDADIIGMLKQHIPGEFEEKKKNLRTHIFLKGRELEGLGYFHLVAFPQWPSFGNYTPDPNAQRPMIASNNGHKGRA